MIKLFQFPGPWDVCSASPFCAKLEAFLRWQNISYQSVIVENMKGAPKGKIPFIENEHGKLGDSNFIIEYLSLKFNLNPDAGLTAEQKAQGRAILYMCEESLYRAMVYFRWVEPQGWKIIKRLFLKNFPKILHPFIGWRVQKYVRNQLYMQGMGRHSRDEIIHVAHGDLKALSDMLGDKPYFFGDKMSTTDLAVFSVTANFLTGPFINPVCDYAKGLSKLVAHADRVRNVCFRQLSGQKIKMAA